MEAVSRGSVRITQRGKALLGEGPVRIDNRSLSDPIQTDRSGTLM